MEDKGAEYPEDGAGGDGPGMWTSRSPGGSGKVRVGNDELEEKSSTETVEPFTAQAGGSWQQGLARGMGGSG